MDHRAARVYKETAEQHVTTVTVQPAAGTCDRVSFAEGKEVEVEAKVRSKKTEDVCFPSIKRSVAHLLCESFVICTGTRHRTNGAHIITEGQEPDGKKLNTIPIRLGRRKWDGVRLTVALGFGITSGQPDCHFWSF